MMQQKAFEMRAMGATYAEIGTELGSPARTVWGWVEEHWKVEAERLTEKVDRLRAMEHRKLQAITRRHLPIALADIPCDHEAQCRSAAIVLKCHERICRIWGIDAPVKVDASVAATAQPLSPEEVAAAVRRASVLISEQDFAAARARLVVGRIEDKKK